MRIKFKHKKYVKIAKKEKDNVALKRPFLFLSSKFTTERDDAAGSNFYLPIVTVLGELKLRPLLVRKVRSLRAA